MTKETKCPKCNKNEAIIDRTYGVLPCQECQDKDEQFALKEKPEFTTISKSNRVTTDRDKHAKDILQPFEHKGRISRDFAKAYPDKAPDYFSDEQLKSL